MMNEFHPIIQQWFAARYGAPTDIQAMSWPRIANGEHLLITAPTGSGKTLTAFLWALNRFAVGELKTGKTRILYISPLKALNNDIRRNLIEPLGEIRQHFEAANAPFPKVQIATRSGDTEQQERRRMQRHPPEILITTPESLNILLSSIGGQNMLHDIDTLILDEIHGVVDSKRGVYLMSAVERLVMFSGEFQRIGLSATVNPMQTVAEFIGGFTRRGDHYHPRTVATLASAAKKTYHINIRYPDVAANRAEDEKIWDSLAQDLLLKINANQSTLIFVNSRALCEKLAFKLNQAAGRLAAYAHHGSLAKEIRADVETRLKQGDLDAIVATSSLEMGIDIGSLDEVILVQSPGSIAGSIQRIGRAGHQVNTPSRCTIYPTHPQDFIEAAVLTEAVKTQSLEPVKVVSKPLDVLSQIIIAMTGVRAWDIDDLYGELRCSMPFHPLTRLEFDLVVNMLRGRYADHHIRDLKPKVRIDQKANTIEARRGALLSVYLSGGVIPDRGYFQLRHEGDHAKIGELDEEFVWEASVGQVFSLGSQVWQVKKITHNDVIVGPGKPGSSAPPFWKAEPINRSFHYSECINTFLEWTNRELANDGAQNKPFRDTLMERYGAEANVANELITYLKRQKHHTGCDLPHRHHLLFETVESGPGGARGNQIVMHTGWGAQVNRPLALAFEGAWKKQFGEQPEVFVANESIVLQLPQALRARELLDMVAPDQIEPLLRIRLEGSGFFGARFRENAGRALLLPKGQFNERKPLWMSRLQSQKLMDTVMKYEDFPILLETWRTCMQDEFDLPNLRRMLTEIADQQIQITEVATTTPSPFAQSVAWDQINAYMYMTDTPKASKTSSLRKDLLEEVVYSAALRPAIEAGVVSEYLTRAQRLTTEYLPVNETDLTEWLKERSAIPIKEWSELLERLGFSTSAYIEIGPHAVVTAEDERAPVSRALGDPYSPEFEIFLGNWLQYYGPITAAEVAGLLCVDVNAASLALDALTNQALLIFGSLIAGSDEKHYCDATTYEYLLRIQRAQHRPSVQAKPIDALPAYLFRWQVRQERQDSLDQLFEVVDSLRGYPMPAGLWESDALPCRIPGYTSSDLDSLFQEGEISWLGVGEKIVTLCAPGDFELIIDAPTERSRIIPDHHARYDFHGLGEITGLSSSELNIALWQEVWRSVVANDSFMALRKAIENDFEMESVTTRRGRRAAFGRWRASLPSAGSWYAVSAPDFGGERDAMAQQELDKERARLLLNRYGVVFRELCLREYASMQWSSIFRALRLMELSGEAVSGRFFEGIPGPQFMTPTSLRHFQSGTSDQVFFINAADPVSPSGMGLGVYGDRLPRRIPSNYLVIHDEKLVMSLARQGKDMYFYVAPDDDSLTRYLGVIHHLCYRAVRPIRRLRIETINQAPASDSPYLAAIEAQFTLFRDHKSVIIQREL